MENNKESSLYTSKIEKEDDFDLGRFLGTLVDNRWLIIGITCIFTLIGIIYVLSATPIYEADALVQVEQNVGNSILSDLTQFIPNTQPPSEAEIELIRSRMVIGKTVDDLNLDIEVKQHFFPIFGEKWAQIFGKEKAAIAVSRFTVPDELLDDAMELKITSGNSYTLIDDGNSILNGKVGVLENKNGVMILVSDFIARPGDSFIIRKRNIIGAINKQLDTLSVADNGKDTGVLSLAITGDDRVEIRKILNSITQNYLQQNVERKSAEAAKSLVFVNEQLPAVTSSLNIAENKLNQYRQNNDSVDLTLEAKSVLDTMVTTDAELDQLTFREAEISKLYTKEHPAYRALLEKRKTLQDEKDSLNEKISKMPKTQQDILRLTRDVEAGQQVYMQLLNKQQELSISKASTVGNVRIIDDAQVQPKPVRPQKVLIVIVMVMLGILVSVSYVYIKSIFHKGIETPSQLEDIGLNVYASIPLSQWQLDLNKSGGDRRNAKANKLLALGNPTDLAVESMRSLRTSLHFAMMEAKNNLLMIAGASPSIGKTFVSSNLAVIVAQIGKKTLLIDADMRKGYVHNLLNLNGSIGLSDYLSKLINLDGVVQKTEIENLDFIAHGQIPPNPSELLMLSRFDELLAWGKENYDIVIIDTPPVLAVTDASIIGKYVGTTLLVGRFEVNTVKEIEVAIRRFEQNGIDVKGIILNAMIKKASNYYSYDGYSYEQYSYKK